MNVSQLRRQLYRWGRILGDVQAARTGSARKVAARRVRRAEYRQAGRIIRAINKSIDR